MPPQNTVGGLTPSGSLVPYQEKKHATVEEAENGFIVRRGTYPYKIWVCKDVDAVVEIIKIALE